jgi:hypothetical protein
LSLLLKAAAADRHCFHQPQVSIWALYERVQALVMRDYQRLTIIDTPSYAHIVIFTEYVIPNFYSFANLINGWDWIDINDTQTKK